MLAPKYELKQIHLGITMFLFHTSPFYACIHIAFGNNLGYGGVNDAPCHFDCVLRGVPLYLDEEIIVENGKLKVAELPE